MTNFVRIHIFLFYKLTKMLILYKKINISRIYKFQKVTILKMFDIFQVFNFIYQDYFLDNFRIGQKFLGVPIRIRYSLE